MFNFNIYNYVDNVAQTPNEYYRSIRQASINDQWDNTTQLYTIKEQVAFPFKDEYEEDEVWVSTVSDDLINYSKVYSNFIRVWFRDIDHKQNYKGQYYKLALDGEHEETYICYDRINKVTQSTDFKCVRCNNVLTWKDENGNIIKMPCYLGTDISSTNNLVGKDGLTPNIRMIILIQANDYTKSIVKNQRFMFEHSTTVKVEEVNNFMQEEGTDGAVTCVKMYVNYSAELPTDNKELNICDYYDNIYSIELSQEEVMQVNGFMGQINHNVFNKDEVVDKDVIWKTDNPMVVVVGEDGRYTIMGNVGETANITCYMKDNETVFSTVKVTVVEDLSNEKSIIITPKITTIDELESVEINCGVYVDGIKQSQDVVCVPSNVESTRYKLVKTENGYILTNLRRNKNPLVLTFRSQDCDDVVLNIKLNGIL